jgi:hypothetical protein
LIELLCSGKETAESIIKSEYCCKGGKKDASQSAVHKYEANGNQAFFVIGDCNEETSHPTCFGREGNLKGRYVFPPVSFSLDGGGRFLPKIAFYISGKALNPQCAKAQCVVLALLKVLLGSCTLCGFTQ